ncbi:hypothetical protein [Flavobacterium macrobrachii]|uniref:hypothetical protein n=1 Tax=Flavobacterium macrobrachii TaxID=591204 RepID=UPI003F72C513
MNHIESIDKSLRENLSPQEIVRKVYLTYPTSALINKEEKQYEILNEISLFFNIPINHIQVCGSSKTGRSFHKVSTFTPKKSDLDIAIIDHSLFLNYTEIVFKKTNGLINTSEFTNYVTNKNNYNSYVEYVSRGIFRPDFMPSCIERVNWFKFFNDLSKKHKDYFKSINAGIYQSQTFFEYKQISNIINYKNSKPI